MARALGVRIGAVVVLVLLLGAVWLGWRVLRGVGAAPVPPPAPRIVDASSQRALPAGDVVGFAGRYGEHVWLGIPYAAPPVGDLRWRPPQPPERWTGTREALAFGAHCPQYASPLGGVEGDPGELRGSEDCLVLNVYAPRFEPQAVPTGAERLPVMVWIHGGGNVIGLADFYDGGRLAVDQRVIVVTLNYRLGPLGWFRHASLREPDADGAARSGNFGTLDLVRALAWVQENIAGFGGDPERVTIFGESAGGTNVFTLLLAPQAKGLFHRAVVQSGGVRLVSAEQAEAWADAGGHRRSSNEIVARLLVREGRADDAAAARALAESMAPGELAAWLRGLPVESLFAAYEVEEGEELLLDMPRVFADGAVLPAGDPLDALGRADGWNRVPVVVGTNRDEVKLFQFADPRWVRQWFGFIPRVRDPVLYLAAADALSAAWKAGGADAPADAMARTWDEVYVYRWDWDEEPTILGFDLATYMGAAHGLEIPFVFGHWDLGARGNVIWSEANEKGREGLSATMRAYWGALAADGRPGRGRDGRRPEWLPWRVSSPRFLVLDTEADGGARMEEGRLEEAAVLAQVEADPRLTSERERCHVYHDLALRMRTFDVAAYTERCPDFPHAEFPWD